MTKGLDFLRTYQREGTKYCYRNSIAAFLSSVYGQKIAQPDLDGFASKYLQETREYEQDVETFFTTLNRRPPKTVHNQIAGVKVYLIENGIELPQRFWRGLSRRTRGSRACTIDRIPTTPELKKIFKHLPLNGKALAMILISSGMRIGEAVQLKLTDIDLTKDPPMLKIRSDYTKSGNSRIAFISGEAKEILEEWLRYRDAYFKRAVSRSILHRKNLNDERIFPYDHAIMNVQLNEALSKAGCFERDSITHRVTVHPHVFRKLFRTKMATAIPVDVVEALMGHEGYLTDVYRRFSHEQLAEFYKKGEPSLTIFSNVVEVEKLKDEIAQKEKVIQTLLTGHTVELIELRQKLSELESRVPVNPIPVVPQTNADLCSK